MDAGANASTESTSWRVIGRPATTATVGFRGSRAGGFQAFGPRAPEVFPPEEPAQLQSAAVRSRAASDSQYGRMRIMDGRTFLSFTNNPDFDRRFDLVEQVDGHLEHAERLDGLGKPDALPLHGVALGL